ISYNSSIEFKQFTECISINCAASKDAYDSLNRLKYDKYSIIHKLIACEQTHCQAAVKLHTAISEYRSRCRTLCSNHLQKKDLSRHDAAAAASDEHPYIACISASDKQCLYRGNVEHHPD